MEFRMVRAIRQHGLQKSAGRFSQISRTISPNRQDDFYKSAGQFYFRRMKGEWMQE